MKMQTDVPYNNDDGGGGEEFPKQQYFVRVWGGRGFSVISKLQAHLSVSVNDSHNQRNAILLTFLFISLFYDQLTSGHL